MKHPFEEAGLGIAPFKAVDLDDNWDKCQFCGQRIKWRYWIEGDDGSRFFVGSNCVERTGEQGVIGFSELRSEHTKRLKRMREAAERKARFSNNRNGLFDELISSSAKFISRNDYSSSTFCQSLANTIKEEGGLTEKQFYWAKMMVKKADASHEGRKDAPSKRKQKGQMRTGVRFPMALLIKEGN